jgi:hypothetical protein
VKGVNGATSERSEWTPPVALISVLVSVLLLLCMPQRLQRQGGTVCEV